MPKAPSSLVSVPVVDIGPSALQMLVYADQVFATMLECYNALDGNIGQTKRCNLSCIPHLKCFAETATPRDVFYAHKEVYADDSKICYQVALYLPQASDIDSQPLLQLVSDIAHHYGVTC